MKLLLSGNEMRERARKIVHNSAVKIEATKGREMNTSKSGKTAIQLTPSLDLDLSVKMGTCYKAEQRNSKGGWEALTRFEKIKYI